MYLGNFASSHKEQGNCPKNCPQHKEDLQLMRNLKIIHLEL